MLGTASGSSAVSEVLQRVVWARGAMNNDKVTDAPAGQRATLGACRMIVPFSSVAPDPAKGIVFAFWAGYLDNGTGEKPLTNDSTWRAGFEANSQTVPLTFGGASSKTVLANTTGRGSVILSDPIYPWDVGLSAWPTTGSAFIRTDVTVPSGGIVPGHVAAAGSGESVRFSADLGTYQSTGTGALTTPSGAQTFGYGPGPLAVLGYWSGKGLPSFGLLGDSIADGTGDTNDTGAGTTSGGFLVRALRGSNVPYVKMTRGGDGYASSSLTSKWAVRKYILRFVTDLIDEFGVNDSQAAATSLAIAQGMYAIAYASGVKRILKTSVTLTGTSSNAYIDKAGQTPYQASNGVQVALNVAMQGVVGALNGPTAYVDVRSLITDPTSTFHWLTNGTTNYPTSDGVHPSATFHGIMAVPIKTYTDTVKALY